MNDSELSVLSAVSELDYFTMPHTRKLFGVQGWIATGEYSISNSKSGISFHPFDQNKYSAALINDILRLAYAAVETFNNLSVTDRASMTAGWAAIQLYYSAYFSAHYLMRLFGTTYTHLAPPEVSTFNSELRHSFPSSDLTIKAGNFAISKIGANEFNMNSSDRSHQGLWKKFDEVLTDVQSNASNSTASISAKTGVISALNDIQRGLKGPASRSGNSSWLSNFRNEINYKHAYNLWYPNQRKASLFLNVLSGAFHAVKSNNPALIDDTTDEGLFIKTTVEIFRLSASLVTYNISRVLEKNALLNRVKRQLDEYNFSF